MHTYNSVLIHGGRADIYRYAAEVERWPEILPHYRSVTVLEPGERERVVHMHCVRSFGPVRWPCRWRARQELLPEQGRILYTHLAGPVKGMSVEWRLAETPEGVLTSIDHELKTPLPLLGKLYADWLVGPLFVQSIAGRTLATIKELVEART